MGQCCGKLYPKDQDIYAQYIIIQNPKSQEFILETDAKKYTEFPKISDAESEGEI